MILAGLTLVAKAYLEETVTIANYGGHYKEGIIGLPRYINPVLSQTNDADRDLVQLVYSGLMKYDGQGNLIKDLAADYRIEDDGLTYIFKLREDAFWHDGERVTADDIVFTIQTIQDFEFKSPIKTNWQGVEIEKVDDKTVRFVLRNTYAPFLHNTIVGILPKHRWQGITSLNFPLAEYNLKPIGSGPYQYKDIKTSGSGVVEEIELVWNENYYAAKSDQANSQTKPYIEKITLKFYDNETSAVDALNDRKVDGLSFISSANLSEINQKNINLHKIQLPRYYAVFFNQTKSKPLADESVRIALNYATNKQAIVDQVLEGQGQTVDLPLLPGFLGYSDEIETYQYSIEKAISTLEENDWSDSDEDGIYDKEINGEVSKLEINLVTINWPELISVAEALKQDWEKIGAQVNLQIVDPAAIQQEYIKPRQYEALLFGEILGIDPDPFAFWHSSRKKDPGLNLALYDNTKADKLLEEARQSLDDQIRQEKYLEFQQIIVEDAPAVFLYSPTYLYPVQKKVQGINIEKLALPSYRFFQTASWFIRTARIEK